MSATPARDALEAMWRDTDWDGWLPRHVAEAVIGRLLANPDAVIDALVEADWTPTDEQLRAMGGERGGAFIESAPARTKWFFPARTPAAPSEEPT